MVLGRLISVGLLMLFFIPYMTVFFFLILAFLGELNLSQFFLEIGYAAIIFFVGSGVSFFSNLLEKRKFDDYHSFRLVQFYFFRCFLVFVPVIGLIFPASWKVPAILLILIKTIYDLLGFTMVDMRHMTEEEVDKLGKIYSEKFIERAKKEGIDIPPKYLEKYRKKERKIQGSLKKS